MTRQEHDAFAFLTKIAKVLCALYDMEAPDLEGILVDDEALQLLHIRRSSSFEQVFVIEHADEGAPEIGLYLAPKILLALAEVHQGKALGLEELAVAIEGVSHVVWLHWRLKWQEPIRALELEMQAEVDKFLVPWVMGCQAHHLAESTARRLRQALFDRFSIDSAVKAEHHDRYITAHIYAERVVTHFVSLMRGPQSRRLLLRQVRLWGRSSLATKMAWAV